MGKKVKVTQELIDRAAAAFSESPTQATGQMLRRAELRALERKGIIRKRPGQDKSGMVRIFWALRSYNLAKGKKVTFG
jgi:hypothetical protein